MYINCKTYYSFRYGTMSAKTLVKAAVEVGVQALALTNINSTCDVWEFVQACNEEGIKPITGVEIRNGDKLLYILLAANNRGMAWIHEFLSLHLSEKIEFLERSTDLPFFDEPEDGFVIYPFGAKEAESLFANERIGIKPSEINKLYGVDVKKHNTSYIVRQPVTFLDETYHGVHRLLRAIDKNVLYAKLPTETKCGIDESFVPPNELLDAFKNFTGIVTNTYKMMEACNIKMEFFTYKNKRFFSGSKEDDKVLLAKLANDGLEFRFGRNNKVARARVEKELKIIDQLNFNAYFLMTYDLIRYAQSRNYFHVGRGSGANSIVAYCLRITDVDPIELDLYFERFLNPYRTSPPDFDIDFSWTDRDEITSYLFLRYGKKHVALLGMYATFKYKAAVRELGKVFGLPKSELDNLAAGGREDDKIHRRILRYAGLIVGFPNHLSVHPGGILISEEPMTNYTTLFMPPKGFATAQLDMYGAENIGLYKIDVLSQRGLGHIKDSVRLVKENQQIDVNIQDIKRFKVDEKVANQIKDVRTIGCFYIESPGMRQLLSKLRCDNYLMLTAASSVIRPGVSGSGMMKQFIERFHEPKSFDYLHPVMEEYLSETFGVMVYQEDVIKIVHYYAGLDEGKADIVRRGMSGKFRGTEQFERIERDFFEGAKKLERPEEITKELWRQIESFGGYSFSKAHSASFAVESYQSLYLKTYFPKEFMVAVINNKGGFYSRELYFLELRKTGAAIHLPCVNNSEFETSIKGNDVYVGFDLIKSLQETVAMNIAEERHRFGAYLHFQDFIERTNITKEQMNSLISIGAFRFTGKSKKQLLWEGNLLLHKMRTHVPARLSLFEDKEKEFKLPVMVDHRIDDMYDELELLGFPLCNPFEMVDDDPHRYAYAKDLKANVGKQLELLGYFITDKFVTTVKQETMCFLSFMDVNLDWIDTVHFPDSLRYYPLKGKGFYKITGKVVEEFGVNSVEVHKMTRVGYKKRKYANL